MCSVKAICVLGGLRSLLNPANNPLIFKQQLMYLYVCSFRLEMQTMCVVRLIFANESHEEYPKHHVALFFNSVSHIPLQPVFMYFILFGYWLMRLKNNIDIFCQLCVFACGYTLDRELWTFINILCMGLYFLCLCPEVWYNKPIYLEVRAMANWFIS